MKNKTTLLFPLFIAIGAAHADSATTPLLKQKIGDVIYSVSESNHLIHVQMPFKTELDLIDNGTNDDSVKYSLSIYGEWDSNLGRPEITELKTQYPGYQIAGESQSVSVDACAIKLSDGTSIACNIPPATGAYFNALSPLSAAAGNRLKADLAVKRYPSIQVTTSYLEPWSTNVQTMKMRPSEDCKALTDKSGRTSLNSVIRGLVKQLPRMGLNSQILDRASEAFMQTCLDPSQVRLVDSASNLNALLSTELRMKENLADVKQIRLEDILWKPAKGIATLSIDAKVK